MKNRENTKSKECIRILSFKRYLVELYRKYKFVTIFGLFISVLLYSLMMSQQLTNTFDGLWHQNYHQAGTAELSSGRWMLIFADKFVMGLHAEPIASILTLILFIIGFIFVLDLFRIEKRLYGCLSLFLFISSTAISSTLSYRFTSFGYGIAYLFSILSVYAIVKCKKNITAVMMGGIFLGACMSCYQAYLAVFCVVTMFYIVFMCSRSDTIETKDVVRILLRMGCSILIGAVFYVASLSLFLRLYQTSLSGYNGISGVTLGGMITSLAKNIIRSYQYFGAYFFMDILKINRFQPVVWLLLAIFLILIMVIAIKIWKTKKQRLVLLICATLAIPIASNAYILVAGNKLELQMTSGLAMFMSLTVILGFSCFNEKHCIQNICMLLCIVLIYGNAMQVWVDQEAMYEGQNACETIATHIIGDLQDEELLASNYDYYFVGVPAENPFFSVSNIYYSANGYAQIGNFWVSGNCCQMSYNGLINKHMGFDLPISYLHHETVVEKVNILEMPIFPENGYMTLIDDHTVVIKISEYKEYTGHSKYVFN
ncbi:MAG: hypothetical protein GX796_12435 [Clostridiaceae bacterium]|nr:hypothetical protein [Clostridiaceae bacterium]